MNDQPLKFVYRETAWNSRSLRRIPDRDQFHRIPLRWQIFSPHCEIPQNSNDSSDFCLALRSQFKSPKPEFNRSGLHVCYRRIPPTWNDVTSQPNFISASRAVSRWHFLLTV